MWTARAAFRAHNLLGQRDKLALEILGDELEHATFKAIKKLEHRWIAVQVVVPMIEMIGKIRDKKVTDGENFRAGARRVFQRDSIVPVPPSKNKYRAIINTLWSALRCGTCHAGFMQDEENKHIDVQITEEDGEPAIKFSDDPADPGNMIVEVGGKAFVDKVIHEVQVLVADLRTNARLREERFLPLWQRRWGSYPP
jgi:hypothetical protein